MKLFDRSPVHPMGFREAMPMDVAESRTQVRLVDVREASEFSGELGHIEGAELVPLATIATAAASWPRDRDIVVICRSGGRSGRAAAQLVSMGFTRIINMTGGMIAWNDARLPTV